MFDRSTQEQRLTKLRHAAQARRIERFGFVEMDEQVDQAQGYLCGLSAWEAVQRPVVVIEVAA